MLLQKRGQAGRVDVCGSLCVALHELMGCCGALRTRHSSDMIDVQLMHQLQGRKLLSH